MNNISKKVYNNSTTPTESLYLAGYQYISNVLQFFPTAEGYVNNTVVSGINQYSYVYNYTDHLGNIRLSYKKNGTTLQILEENNYYPFGLKHTYYNTTNAQPNYKYKYNGKEYQDELGLNFYDYGARNYDASIGRWMNVDPLAEKYHGISSYNYVSNNPIIFIDLNGMGWVSIDNNVFWDDRVTTPKEAIIYYGNNATYLNIGYKWTSDEGEIILGEDASFSLNGENMIALNANPDIVGQSIMDGGWDTFIYYYEKLGIDYFYNVANCFTDNATGLMLILKENIEGVSEAIKISMLIHRWVDGIDGNSWTKERNELEHKIGMFLIAEKYGVAKADFIGTSNEIRGLLINDRQNGNMTNAIEGKGGTAFEWNDIYYNREGIWLWKVYNNIPIPKDESCKPEPFNKF